jgi:CubicO group peptidase (beta-lactamase class C family)
MRRLILSSVVLVALLPAAAQARSTRPEPVRHPGLEALIKRFADEARSKAKKQGEKPLEAAAARTRS